MSEETTNERLRKIVADLRRKNAQTHEQLQEARAESRRLAALVEEARAQVELARVVIPSPSDIRTAIADENSGSLCDQVDAADTRLADLLTRLTERA